MRDQCDRGGGVEGGCGCSSLNLCCLFRPHRRQASSHRYITVFKACGGPVGAGLPAMGCEAAPLALSG
ncbi:hypothetical protein CXG45_20940 [Pseudomonas plecoglossicida]|uniref:Diguanylate cyclase n=1 Tax=Pseudomonas plecoglossicida TaxID=70775 RepID=A0ABX4U979_PSEDL|nr:hypothetical protein CXG44_20800 [Pseudomonas plecoglossicida]PLU90950.1 hypothetical protein CXG45_20940 [Pseudomonas plecoglossicida]PLV00484.1 hypothetical protein CXG48_21580 [Pseudomonas plecoglossicida]PLV15944.1 hypothetical protein CXG47_03485 [Pseudomonas plecoglossicida]